MTLVSSVSETYKLSISIYADIKTNLMAWYFMIISLMSQNKNVILHNSVFKFKLCIIPN
jgi:hypothetical protein